MTQVAIEAQREQEFQRPGLTRAIGALEDRPAITEIEDLLAELPDVEDPRPDAASIGKPLTRSRRIAPAIVVEQEELAAEPDGQFR